MELNFVCELFALCHCSSFKAQGSRLKAQDSRLKSQGNASLSNSAAFVQKAQVIWSCARTVAKQPVLRINTMIRKINMSQLIWDYRSVFVVAASAILEGERDYSEQTLATPTLQRMRFLHRVVNMLLASVKVQCVKVRFLVKSNTVVYTITRITFAHNSKTKCLYFCVLWRPGSHSTTLRVWPRQNNELWIIRFCCHAQMWLWWAYEAHV